MSHIEAIFGKAAIKLGFIDLAVLNKAVNVKKRKKGPLYEILCAMKAITEEQLWQAMEALHQKASDKLDRVKEKKEDYIFGRLAVEMEICDLKEMSRAVREQAKLEYEDQDLRLSQVAVNLGIMARNDAVKVLNHQLNTIIICPKCLKKYDITKLRNGQKIRCSGCKETIPIRKNVEYSDAELIASRLIASDVSIDSDAKDSLEEEFNPDFGEDEALPKTRYVIHEEVARGGMGRILSVLDPSLDREVAMKVLLAFGKVTKKQVQRFITEAKVTGRLEHPNIVPVHELGLDPSGGAYFTMKMVRGRSLADILRGLRRKKTKAIKEFTTARLLNIFVSICDAVAFAHSRDVIHRDLKPENIMVGDYGEVLVMDWGLAKILGEDDVHRESVALSKEATKGRLKTLDGTVMGTPAFMSPEQARGHLDKMDQRSDVYSLGAILYEILTLQTPYTGNSALEIIEQVKRKTPASPEQRAPARNISRELSEVAMKCLARKRSERYKDVRALKSEIEAYMAGRVLKEVEYNIIEVAWKWIKRNKAIVGGATAAIVALTLGIVLMSVKAGRDRINEAKSNLTAAKEFLEEEEYESASAKAFAALTVLGENSEARKVVEKASIALQRERKQDMVHLHLKKGITILEDGNIAGELDPDKFNVDKPELQSIKSKMQVCLNSLSEFNFALALDPEHERTREYKHKVVERLAELACASGDFMLADYMAGEAISEDDRKLLKKFVEEKRTATLKANRARVKEIMGILEEGNEEAGQYSDFLFEITRMQEEGIVDDLIKSLDSDSQRAVMLAAESLGRIGNKKGVSPILDKLEEWAAKLYLVHPARRKLEDLTFMVKLADAVGNIGDDSAKERMSEIRGKMGKSGNFWSRTTLVYRKLLKDLPDMNEKTLSKSDDPDYWDRLGRDYVKVGDLPAAIRAFTKVIEIDPNAVEAHNNRASAKAEMGDHEGAIEDYTKAIELFPNYPGAYANRGLAKESAGRILDAIMDYNEAIKLDPNFITAYNNRASARQKLGNPTGAIEDLTTAIGIDPKRPNLYHNRGRIERQIGNLERAINDFTRAIFLDPKFTQAFVDRALVYRLQGKVKVSIEDLNSAIELDPKNWLAYERRATAKYQNDPDGAIEDCDKSIKLNPNNAGIYVTRGMAKSVKGDEDGAIADYNKAIELDPNRNDALNNRAVSKMKKKDYDGAIEDCKKIIERVERFDLAWFNMAKAYVAKGNLEEALKALAKAIEYDNNHNLKEDARNNPAFKPLHDNPEFKKLIAD
ncbi:MAG: tetratricopeptide repeat protein [Planctomycetota bacterium]|nr:MAG: tetratricopeptide repeat protein [Planctomycetota bacterium]